MILKSSFPHNQRMPDRYTCKETKELGMSPPLAWVEPPSEARSFALICEDPDAVHGPFVHWVVYNLPGGANSLPEGAFIEKNGGNAGLNSAGEQGWYNVCPPKGSGTHHYIFTLYALDREVQPKEPITADSLRAAMKGHILQEAQLVGLYSIE